MRAFTPRHPRLARELAAPGTDWARAAA
jgi:hypothetical protein